MIIVENTIYGTPEEIDVLKGAESLRDTGLTFEEASEAFLRLAACFAIVEDNFSEFCKEAWEGKKEQKRFRCRVCGRHYDFKGEAKACERDHKQWRR